MSVENRKNFKYMDIKYTQISHHVTSRRAFLTWPLTDESKEKWSVNLNISNSDRVVVVDDDYDNEMTLTMSLMNLTVVIIENNQEARSKDAKRWTQIKKLHTSFLAQLLCGIYSWVGDEIF